MKNKFLIIIILLLIISPINPAEKPDSSKSFPNNIIVIPGAHYKAGWLHKIFFGAHWRDLWTTPLEVEILDLDKFEGGIKPYKKGGGFQTKSLRFKGNDGREWKFRSIDKDPSKVLPDDLRESLVSDIIKDQISSANPLAPIIVVPLLNAVGVFQAEPKIIYLPDTEKLGEFRKEFGGLLGMIEIHPQDEEGAAFKDAEKVKGTFDLLHRLEEKRDEKVDLKEFLKARLMDIFFGDWDRHTDQWRWARFDKGNLELWHPIPRDRDQAFAKFDGLFPSIASYYTPQLVHFGENYPQIEDITWSGRFLDRRFLSELTKDVWDSITAFVYERLTNQLIEDAVKLLPTDFYSKAGYEIEYKLKQRRNDLFEISNEYYQLINKVVDIYATNKEDFAEVKRLNDNQTEVIIFKKNKETGKKEDKPLYHKIFENNLTKEIRIFLLDDDDKSIITGEVNRSPLIRIIAGNGEDELIDSSVVKGYFLSIIPIFDAENKTGFYESGRKTKYHLSSGTYIDKEEIPEPKDDFERYEPQQRDRGHDWLINPIISYNSDDGFLFGGGPILIGYNFRAVPFDYWMTLTGAYATTPKSYRINYNGIFYSLIKGTSIELELIKSQLNLTKYYGYGNETLFNKDLEKNNFYRLEQELFHIRPSINFSLFKNNKTSFSFSYDASTVSLQSLNLISNFPDSGYGLGAIHQLGVQSSIVVDSRDNTNNPYTGFYLNIEGTYYPEFLDIKEGFTKTNFDIRSYFSAQAITFITLALRAGGGKVFGNYPFNKAFFLGGKDNLRGYSRERFSGDSGLFGQAELRAFLTRLKVIILGDLGFHIFGETGRVYIKNDDSKKWHPSYGGGFWISFLKRQLNLSFTIALSPETTAFYFRTKLGF